MVAGSDPVMSGFVSSDGLQIYYAVYGSGPTMVLVHGWGADGHSNWVEPGWVDTLSGLRQLICIDVRGHGRSDKPHAHKPYGYAAMARDVIAVMDGLSISSADYMGYSMGAFMGAILSGADAYAAINKCVDASGQVTFSSKPCPGDQTATKVAEPKSTNFVRSDAPKPNPNVTNNVIHRFELTDHNGVRREVTEQEFERQMRENKRIVAQREAQKKHKQGLNQAAACYVKRDFYINNRVECYRSNCHDRLMEAKEFVEQRCGGF